MRRAWVFHGKSTSEVDDPWQAAAQVGHGADLVWLDIAEPTDDDYTQLADRFSLHPLALDEARDRAKRPRIEQYPTHAYLVAQAVLGPGSLSEMDLFIGPGWIVTLRQPDADGRFIDVDRVHERFERTRGDTATVGMLLYELLDQLVDGYFDATDRIEDEIEEVERRIWDAPTAGSPDVQRRLLSLRGHLVHLRRMVSPLRDVMLTILRDEIAWVSEHDQVYFQNVLDHLLRAVDQIDTARELLGNAVDANLAMSANNMNVVMKKMTSWGAILLGSSLVAGIYGMNFKVIPGSDNEVGFVLAISSMLFLTVVLAVWFKSRDWL